MDKSIIYLILIFAVGWLIMGEFVDGGKKYITGAISKIVGGTA